jgi:GTPase SAR1 family protein
MKELPQVYNPVKIPPDQCMDGCWVTIIDSLFESYTELDETIKEEIDEADIILLLFDITNEDSAKNIKKFWVRTLKSLTNTPIMVVANKIDKKTEKLKYELNLMFEEIAKINVEAIFECSCVNLEGIAEIFINLQKVVLYPSNILIDLETGKLRPEFLRALKLVFRKIDKNKDFLLSEHELMQMQLEVFKEELTCEGAQQIISLVNEVSPNGVEQNSLNFAGFCSLQLILIQNSQPDICWKTLYYFGFDRSLQLSLIFSTLTSNSHYLSRSALSYLLTVFDQYSQRGYLSAENVLKIFEPCPYTPNNKETIKIWKEITEKVEITENCLNLNSWLAYWTLLSYKDPSKCFKFLMYIGCSLSISEIFTNKTDENQLKVVYLAGINSVGKTWLINTLLNKTSTSYIPTSSLKPYCIPLNSNPVPWLATYTIIYEVPLILSEEVLKSVNHSEYILVLTNEKVESEEFINKLGLGSQGNIRILKNPLKTLKKSDIFDFFLKLSPQSPQPSNRVSLSMTLFFLTFSVLFFSILYSNF